MQMSHLTSALDLILGLLLLAWTDDNVTHSTFSASWVLYGYMKLRNYAWNHADADQKL